MKIDKSDRPERLAKVQGLILERPANHEILVDALMSLNYVSEERALAAYLADETIPFEIRQQFGSPLTDNEKTALKQGGLDLTRTVSADKDPQQLGYRQVADVLIECLSVDEVASRIGITGVAVNELADKRQLYSIEGEYGLRRFPAFQIDEDMILPGFTRVAPMIPLEWSMINVHAWFTEKHFDLHVNEDFYESLSPVEWLSSCYGVEAIAKRLKMLDP